MSESRDSLEQAFLYLSVKQDRKIQRMRTQVVLWRLLTGLAFLFFTLYLATNNVGLFN